MEKEKLTALVEQTRAGDPEALRALIVETYPSVAYLCRKMLKNKQDAEDVTQDVLLQICRKLDTLQTPAAY